MDFCAGSNMRAAVRNRSNQKPVGETHGIRIRGQNHRNDRDGLSADHADWSRELAGHIAGLEQLTLTQRHWDLIDYLRDEYFNNNENMPNTRAILKAMSEKWSEKIDQRTLYDLFPLDPSKQGGRIAGLPESRRKGGY